MSVSIKYFLICIGCFVVANGLFGADINSPPNVVIMLTDDQGTLDARCYGAMDLRTPNIDRLAETGVRFTQAYAHTVCCPTRAAILTGRHPQRGGVNDWTQGNLKAKTGVNMSLEEITLAEAFKAKGYRTALFGKWHVGAAEDSGPTRQGFDEFFGLRGGFIDNFNHYYLHQTGYHDLYEGTQEQFKPGEFFPDLMVERALSFLTVNKDRPFFLYLPFNTPHYPEQAPEKFLKMYDGLEEPRRTYAAFVTMTDANIGRVIERLESLGLLDNTIVVYMSDNGHSVEDKRIEVDNHRSGLPKGHYYSAHGGGGYTGKWIGHKSTFLEGGIRVPAVISYPAKLPKGAVRHQAITVMDWFPTLLEMCDAGPPAAKLDGRSLLSVIEFADAPSPHKILHFQWIKSWAVREGDWKLICKQGRGAKAKAHYSLHNLAEVDPEVADHAADEPDIVNRLRRLHEAWAKEVSPRP
ncbi:MAG: sulfatase-like hydrolase/transferase [Verrucomicrobia bacterium]|nr:sulfatase-like hydrolase/transferase [Verrucomicrobiota bacterium]